MHIYYIKAVNIRGISVTPSALFSEHVLIAPLLHVSSIPQQLNFVYEYQQRQITSQAYNN